MTQRREFRELVPPERVRELIHEFPIERTTAERPIAEAGGDVSAEKIVAEIDVPGFDRAGMDGYAVHAADTFGADERDPAMLDVVGTVHAGMEPDVIIDAGEAVEISTGAVLPPGADAVVMVERTHDRNGGIAVETSVAPGDHVMSAGADIGAGREVIRKGQRLTMRDVAVLAAVGRDVVTVYEPPVVGIISTGDELVRPGNAVDHRRGQIFDVNSHSIAAAVRHAGGMPQLYPHVGDDYDQMRDILEQAATECAIILSSGSTSASAVDMIYRVIEESGELLVHGVAMKPGKPMLVGRMQDAAYIGLPGYPVSALMVFQRFVADRIRTAAGRDPETRPVLDAEMAAEERFGEGRMRLLPVGTVTTGDDRLLAYPVDKGSGATTSLADADGVVEVPADTAFVEAGETVSIYPFSDDMRPPSLLCVGEEDPVFVEALSAQPHVRFLPVGTTEGKRRFERGIPDLVVIAGDDVPSGGIERSTWTRTWGLLVPAGNPASVEGIADLIDGDLRFVNLRRTALRTAFDESISSLAADRDTTHADLSASIDGYGRARATPESGIGMIERGEVDVSLGLASHADRHSVELIPLGQQAVSVIVADDRRDKPAVDSLTDRLP